jgi:hypothetical protein
MNYNSYKGCLNPEFTAVFHILPILNSLLALVKPHFRIGQENLLA